MKKLILIIFLIIFSCKEEISTVEKRIHYSSLNEPQNNIYIELLSYYPALNKSQSNLYIVKDIHNNDTLYVVDKDTLSVSNFIKNYNGIENTSLIIRRGEMKSKKEYLVNMPSNNAINNKKLYLGELIRLTD